LQAGLTEQIMMKEIPPEESLIEYPSDFPIKVMGKSHPELAQILTAVVQEFDPDFDPATVEMRPSRNGTYIGLTFTVRATSRDQLDALYRALHGHDMVAVVL
jgi:putative lipoic acid-binding regulatory protein